MTTTQVKLVKDSFAVLAPMSDTAGQLFYQRLFEVEPGLRPMFRGDLHEQARKLMQVLAMVVNGLDRPEQILPLAAEMGRRHIAYGVQHDHYAVVGSVLLWTLAKGLGPDFTAEVKDAWTSAYTMLADTMQRAAQNTTQEIPAFR
jgi:hemoglobin-like flavoprotein